MSGPLYYVFCDGSVNARLNLGVGAILILSSLEFEKMGEGSDLPIQTKLIPTDSIARVEIMAALWALSDPRLILKEIELFTDCKTIEGLSGRRARLEARSFKSGRTGELLSNADLYQEFYKVCDTLHPKIHWLKGHSSAKEASKVQRIFGFVDKRARQVLRQQS